MDKESFYFPHEYNPTSDPKIVCLLGNHGGLGYAVYWRSVEMLHQEKTNKLPLKQYIFEAIAKQMLTIAKQIEDIINDCIKIYELFESDGISFWSNRVLRNLEKRAEISNIRREAGKKGAIAKQNLANDSKEKENKVNIKENENKEKEIIKENIVAEAPTQKIVKTKINNFKSLSIEEFRESLVQYEKEFSTPFILDFFEHWSEQDQYGKMKFQLCKTWGLKMRLSKWIPNKYDKSAQSTNGNKPAFVVQKSKTEKRDDMLKDLMNDIEKAKVGNFRDVEVEIEKLPAQTGN